MNTKNFLVFLRKFYGVPEKKEKKPAQKKFSWSNFYERKKFYIWGVISFIALAVAIAILSLSMKDLYFVFVLLAFFLAVYTGWNFNKHDKNKSCYQNESIFVIWAFLTFALYTGCCCLFVKQDLVNLHRIGPIIGTIVGVIFTLCLPLITHALRLNTDSSSSADKEVSEEEDEATDDETDEKKDASNEEKPVFPTSEDKKMHGRLMLLTAITLSTISVFIFWNDNDNQKNKKQEMEFEQMAFKDISNKTFIVDDRWLRDEVYAIIETSDDIVAVKVVDYPEVYSATKVKVLGTKPVTINRQKYPAPQKIKFEDDSETPAPE